VAADLNEPVSEIETVAASIANVDLVGPSISSVNTVAPSIGDVVIVADNIAAVNNLSDAVTNGDLLTGVYQGAYAANPIKRLDNSSLQNGDHLLQHRHQPNDGLCLRHLVRHGN